MVRSATPAAEYHSAHQTAASTAAPRGGGAGIPARTPALHHVERRFAWHGSCSPAECGVSKTIKSNILDWRPRLAPLCRPRRPVRRAEPAQELARNMDAINEHETGDLWVFGYGSLMWRPGFDVVERVPARLMGLHRALCVFSFVHRGTPEKPGLVLGLDRGGICRGIAFRVAAAKRDQTITYLRDPEQGTDVYLEALRRIQPQDE